MKYDIGHVGMAKLNSFNNFPSGKITVMHSQVKDIFTISFKVKAPKVLSKMILLMNKSL